MKSHLSTACLASLLLLSAACGANHGRARDAGTGQASGGNGGGGAQPVAGSAADSGSPAFTVTVSASVAALCPGQCVTLTPAAIGGVEPYTFKWDHDLGSGDAPVSVCPTESTRYTVTVTDSSHDTEFSDQNPPVSSSVDIDVVPEGECVDGSVPMPTEGQCTLRAHVTGSIFGDVVRIHHQSVVDAQGNLVMVGSFNGVLKAGDVTLTGVGTIAGFVIKVDPNCHVLWGKAFGGQGSGHIYLSAIAADAQGDVYVGGGMYGKNDFGDIVIDGQLGYAGLLVKLAADGGILWSKVYTSETFAVAVMDLVMDAQQRLTFVGAAGSDTSFGGPVLNGSTTINMPFLAQVDAAGGFIWSKSFDSSDLQFNLANGPHDDGIVLTSYNTDMVDFGAGPLALGIGGRYLAKLSSTGEQEWLRALPRGDDYDQWSWWKGGVAVDATGAILVLRDEPETLADNSNAMFTNDSVEKYAIDGTPLWERRLSYTNTYDNPWGSALAMLAGDRALRFGAFKDTIVLGGETLVSHGANDVALIALDAEGKTLWTQAFGSELDDRVLGVATRKDSIFATYVATDSAVGNEADLVVVKLVR